MAIIELMTGSSDGIGVTLLAEELGVNKGMAHRLLTSMESLGYVSQDEVTQRYRLTTKLLGLSIRHLVTLDIYDIILPILRRLATDTGELAELYWENEGRLVLVVKADSPRRVKVVDHLGDELKMHASAAGKAWLAHIPADEALRIVLARGMEKYTDATITNLVEFQEELVRVREAGFAINAKESDEDVSAISAPVFSLPQETRAAGALSIVAPAYRAVHTNPEIQALVRAAAAEISSVWPLVAAESGTSGAAAPV